MTNILLLPLYQIVVETYTNEDALGHFGVESGEPKQPLSLAGINFRMELRTSAPRRVVHLEATIANGRLAIVGAENNVLAIAIDQAVMGRLAERDYDWDVLAVADGHERRMLFGTWRHRLGVTKP